MEDRDGFWDWVATRRACDNPRGDFIRDTRDLMKNGGDPGAAMQTACPEAWDEYLEMRRKYRLAMR